MPPVEQPLWITMFAILGIFIGAMLVGGALQHILEKIVGGNIDKGFSNFLTYIVVFGITIGFAVWLLLARGTERPIFRFVSKRPDPTTILWGFVLIVVTSVVIEPLIEIFSSDNVDLLHDIVRTGGWAMLTTLVMAPILEEVLFRGIIQEVITREYGRIWGILFASFLFGLAHMPVYQQAVNAFFVGIILGYIYYKTDSLIPVIIIHALNNAIAYIMMTLFDDGVVMTRDIISSNTIYWIIYGLCSVVFLIAIVSMVAHLRKDKAEQVE